MREIILLTVLADAKIFIKDTKAKIQRITGGSLASIERFPYLVYVSHGGKSCGGSIISKNHILTAAHCVCRTSRLCYVHSGSENKSYGGTWTEVNRIICHKKYDQTGMGENDLAILVLGTKFSLEFDNKTRSVPMVEREPNRSWGYVSGWGDLDNDETETEKMRIAAVDMKDEIECFHEFGLFKTPGTICAGTRDGRDACFGDSGGPLVVEGYLVGVVSQGPDECGADSLYASVIYYRDWIEKKMAEPIPEGKTSGFWEKFWDVLRRVDDF